VLLFFSWANLATLPGASKGDGADRPSRRLGAELEPIFLKGNACKSLKRFDSEK
jgi:hypothetical protein